MKWYWSDFLYEGTWVNVILCLAPDCFRNICFKNRGNYRLTEYSMFLLCRQSFLVKKGRPSITFGLQIQVVFNAVYSFSPQSIQRHREVKQKCMCKCWTIMKRLITANVKVSKSALNLKKRNTNACGCRLTKLTVSVWDNLSSASRYMINGYIHRLDMHLFVGGIFFRGSHWSLWIDK